MTIEDDFLVWAPSGGNVMSQAAYAANGALANGVTNGIADPTLYNKSLRQSSIIASVIAQFIVLVSGQPAIDNGTTATLLANFMTSVGGTYTYAAGPPGVGSITLPAGLILNFGNSLAVNAGATVTQAYATAFTTTALAAWCSVGATSGVNPTTVGQLILPPAMQVRGAGSALNHVIFSALAPNDVAVDWAVLGL